VREPASAAPRSSNHESAASEPGAQQPVPTSPPGDGPQPAHTAQLVVQNPADNGGTVHFLIGQEVVSLLPGETRHFSGDSEWLLRFHRGDVFDNVATVLPPGLYQFVVDREGWRLTPVTAPHASGVTP